MAKCDGQFKLALVQRYLSGEGGRVAPNLLERKFDAAVPNMKWVADVTEFNVDGQKL